MAQLEPAPLGRGAWRNTSGPVRLLILGGIVVALAVGLAQVPNSTLAPVRVGLIVVSLVLGLRAVTLRFAESTNDVTAKTNTAAHLAGGSFLALGGCLACDPEWDSFRFLLGVLLAVGLIGAVLCLLPQGIRRGTFLLLGGIHFVGILTAVFSVPPPSGVACWLSNAMWTVFYRPYLQFMYLNNAYHFYSPDPGPPTLLWFRVQYASGKAEWVKIPNREDFPTRLQFQRRLALTESTNINLNPPPRLQFELILRRRRPDPILNPNMAIPMHPEVDPVMQFREPSLYSKKMLAAYSLRMVNASKTSLNSEVTSVKVYRVVHHIVQPREMAGGQGPLDEVLYMPYYMGEYTWLDKRDPVTGQKILEESTGTPIQEWQLKDPNDPLLYWLIPILKEPRLAQGELFDPRRQYPLEVRDWVSVHSGDSLRP